MVNLTGFLEGCLRAARETPGFCDGVPRQDEFRRTVTWPSAQCRGSSNPRCPGVMQGKLRYCQEGRPKGTRPVPGIDQPVPPDTGEPVDMEPIDPGSPDATGRDTSGRW